MRFFSILIALSATNFLYCKPSGDSHSKKAKKKHDLGQSKEGEGSGKAENSKTSQGYDNRAKAAAGAYSKAFETAWEGKTIRETQIDKDGKVSDIVTCVEFTTKEGACRYNNTLDADEKALQGTCYIKATSHYVGVYCEGPDACGSKFSKGSEFHIVMNQFTDKKTVSGPSNKVIMKDDDGDTAIFEVVAKGSCEVLR